MPVPQLKKQRWTQTAIKQARCHGAHLLHQHTGERGRKMAICSLAELHSETLLLNKTMKEIIKTMHKRK